MRDQMQKMHEMGKPGAMPKMDMKMGGMNGSMMQNHQAVQRRMEMMEMMMGQMVQHQEAEEASKPAK
jgi:hypothetical protein